MIANRRVKLLWGLLALLTACATTTRESGPAPDAPGAEALGDPTEELERVRLTSPEELYLRPGWPIGGYDTLMFAPVELRFDAKTRVRTADRERLENLVVKKASDQIVAAGLSVQDQAGPCTLLARTRVLDIDLYSPTGGTGSRVNYVSSWGRATIEFNLFDSQTGTQLVHFVARRRIPGSVHGSGRDWSMIEQAMEGLLADSQLAMEAALKSTRMASTRPNCRGSIYEAFRALGAASE